MKRLIVTIENSQGEQKDVNLEIPDGMRIGKRGITAIARQLGLADAESWKAISWVEQPALEGPDEPTQET